jgi:peptidyl-prolyl cis-trans isomerase A (cyclophilin A)
MKKNTIFKLVFSLFLIVGLSASTNIYSQTVVQWYTSMGDIRVQLREDLVPITAQNFIDLTNDEFYDDFIFHRVISNFMIQDGCPNGNGTGGPGYTFDDEFHPDLRHDQPGIISMANSGPNTNGSQYFITVEPTVWLDDVHSVFGKVMDGMDVVYAISEVETDNNDKPIVDVVIDSIRVVAGDPDIELIAPLAGIKWNGHMQNEIQWDSEFIADVKIEFSSDNGASWSDIAESVSAHYRSFLWTAPVDLISTECMVKISDVANPDVFSITENPFALCKLELFTPDGYGFYRVGSPIEITWDSEMVDDLIISYKASIDGDWVIIDEGIPASDNYYLWTPVEAKSWCKIQLEEIEHPEAYEKSNNRFLIFKLDLTSPQGGESIQGYNFYDITWESEIINDVKIEFSSDSMQTWNIVESSLPAEDSVYAWLVPNIESEDCFIKLTSPELPDLYTVNQTAFTINETVGIYNGDVDDASKLLVFPNPVIDVASISIREGHITGNNIEIYNSSGKLVLCKDVVLQRSKNQLVKLNLSELDQGLFVIKLLIDNKSVYHKFIKTAN